MWATTRREPIRSGFPVGTGTFVEEMEADDPVALMSRVNERLLPLYVAGLDSERWRVRRKAARGLATLGTVAAEAIPALKRIAERDADSRVREAAAETLKRLGAEESA
jgi:HEAT repeat protein